MRGLRPLTERIGLRVWAWVAQRPALYALGARFGARYLKWLAGEDKSIRLLPPPRNGRCGRDFPAPQGKTFREEACRARGIVVSNIRGYAVHTVPEHAIALMMALSRNLVAYRESVQAGRWQQSDQFCFFDHPIRDLHGATLAIIGSGSLGDGVARLAEAFGMTVLKVERKGAAACRPGYTAFADALASADIVSLHCPLNAETQGLIGAAELQAMKRTALLINTSRGGLVDEVALVQALKEGRIAGAGFDVLSKEPPKEGNPLLAPELLALPNFLLTPHVAWASRPAMQVLVDQLIDNIEAFTRGEPQNRVA
jgi:glycerate dehydrogenase